MSEPDMMTKAGRQSVVLELLKRNAQPPGTLHKEWGEAHSAYRQALVSATRPPTDFIAPTPAQLLLERILGALQAQMMVLDGLPETYEHAQLAVINEQCQDEIIQLDAGQIPESIREAYEALQEHAPKREPRAILGAPTNTPNPAMSPVLMGGRGGFLTMLHWDPHHEEWDICDADGHAASSWSTSSLLEFDAEFIPLRIEPAVDVPVDEPAVVDYQPPDRVDVLYTFDEGWLVRFQAGETDDITMTVGVQPVRVRIAYQPTEDTNKC